MKHDAQPRPAEPVTVLLVEDNPDDRELTLSALAGVAPRVVLARDGVEALDYLLGRAPLPALVLLDLKMPRVDGLQVLQVIRSDPRLAALRVVVLSSSDEERDRERCRQLGVTDYLRKEVDFALFREQVRALWPRWVGTDADPRGYHKPP
jgi:two-component system response regulator